MTKQGTVQRIMEITATTFVLIASSLLIWSQVEARWLRPNPNAPQRVSGLRIDSTEIRHSKGTGSVALVEFTDYECPFCGQFARSTAPEVDRQLVDTGAVTHIVVNFPLERTHRQARDAAQAAECASLQGKYWEMYEYLFNNQDKFDAKGLRDGASALSLRMADFDQCLGGQTDGQISSDLKIGERLGVNSTPTFFVGIVQPDGSIALTTRFAGAVLFETVSDIIEDVVAPKSTWWSW